MNEKKPIEKVQAENHHTLDASPYLWNGTEIEDTLVAEAGQVGDDIWDVT